MRYRSNIFVFFFPSNFAKCNSMYTLKYPRPLPLKLPPSLFIRKLHELLFTNHYFQLHSLRCEHLLAANRGCSCCSETMLCCQATTANPIQGQVACPTHLPADPDIYLIKNLFLHYSLAGKAAAAIDHNYIK